MFWILIAAAAWLFGEAFPGIASIGKTVKYTTGRVTAAMAQHAAIAGLAGAGAVTAHFWPLWAVTAYLALNIITVIASHGQEYKSTPGRVALGTALQWGIAVLFVLAALRLGH